MRPTMAPAARLMDQDLSTVHGGVAYVHASARRLAPSFERAEPRPRAMDDRRGLLRPAERNNSGPWAAVSGDTTPSGVQPVLRRALWDPDAVREARRPSVLQQLGDPPGVRVIEATGCVKQGQHSAGVARP